LLLLEVGVAVEELVLLVPMAGVALAAIAHLLALVVEVLLLKLL
jgi:hypothetical protein